MNSSKRLNDPRRGFAFVVLVVLFSPFYLIIGCAKHPVPPSVPDVESASRPAIEGETLVVISRKGETLSSLSRRYTGKASNWKKIAKANPGIDAQRIRMGQQITIPNILLAGFAKEELIPRPLEKAKIDRPEKLAAAVDESARERRGLLKREPSEMPKSASGIREESLVDSAPRASRNHPSSSARPAVSDTGTAEMSPEKRSTEKKPAVKAPAMAASPEAGTSGKKGGKAGKAEKASPSARERVISSSGYGSLNREMSRLDASLAKAEALAREAKRQQVAASQTGTDSRNSGEAGDVASASVPAVPQFSCNGNRCSKKK